METRIVCSKCGRSEEYTRALAEGWLYHQREGQPEGYLVIRCPAHISGWARRQAGLPGEHRVKRIEDNLERGLWLWADFRTSRLYSAVVRKEGAHRYEMSFRTPGIQEHGTEDFQTIDDLIEAMREIEPDLRRWHPCETEV